MRRRYKNIRVIDQEKFRTARFDLLDLEMATAVRGITESLKNDEAVPVVIRIEVDADVPDPVGQAI